MKVFLAVLIALGVMAAVPDNADARKRSRSVQNAPPAWAYGPPRTRYYRPYAYPPYGYQPYRESEHSDSTDCIVARSLDPGGNYASYPCWAQRALAPKKQN